MGFVSIWKTVSIALTGAFGILGLLTNFKDRATDKITKWGYISLFGIVLSTIFGVVAQIKETWDESAKALRVAETTQTTLSDLTRLLTPAGDPVVQLSFRISCDDPIYLAFCEKDLPSPGSDQKSASQFIWSQWPGAPIAISTYISIEIYKDEKKARYCFDYDCEGQHAPDIHAEIKAQNDGDDANLYAYTLLAPKGQAVGAEIKSKLSSWESYHSNGTISSTADFDGAIAVVHTYTSQLANIGLKELSMRLRFLNGETVESSSVTYQHSIDDDEYFVRLKRQH